MPNPKKIRLGILYAFFIGSVALGQSPGSDVHVEITKEIHDVRMTLTKDIGALNTEIAVLKNDREWMKEDIRDLQESLRWLWRVLTFGLLSTIGLYFLKRWWERRD